MKGHYFNLVEKKYTPISENAYAGARELADAGFISTSTKYRSVSRPIGAFENYGYEWHARCNGESHELDAETYAAFREVAPPRCGHCGQTGGAHADGCKYLAHSREIENAQLRSKLCAAMAEIAELKAKVSL